MQETRSYDRVDVSAMDNVLVFFYSIEIEQTKFEKLLHFMRRLNFLGFMVVEVCSQHTGTQHRQKKQQIHGHSVTWKRGLATADRLALNLHCFVHTHRACYASPFVQHPTANYC